MPQDIKRSDQFVDDALTLILEAAGQAIRDRGEFRISLCGGSTPRPVYEALRSTPEVDWAKVLITFGDERCVPPQHERSNFRMAREAFLDKVTIPERQILRMEGENEPAQAAQAYEDRLRAEAERAAELIFTHDLVLLGMGEDGHTASLFPETQALEETERWVVANNVPKFNEDRLTMTFPLINAARHICFLVTGNSKRPIYERIFSGQSTDPAAKIAPSNGQLTWLLGT